MKFLGFIMITLMGLNAFSAPSGIFFVVRGNVFIERLKGEVVKAKIKSVIYPGESVYSEPGATAKIVMSDRNIINVLPNTKFKIEKYVNDGKDKSVGIKLNQGRLRADVNEKYDGEKNKFEILTPVAVVGVRGTQLVVSYDPAVNATEIVTFAGEVYVRRLGTLTGAMGFGENGLLTVKAQEHLLINQDSKNPKVDTMKVKDFQALDKETEITDDMEDKSGIKN